jgi:hypothetical protein
MEGEHSLSGGDEEERAVGMEADAIHAAAGGELCAGDLLKGSGVKDFQSAEFGEEGGGGSREGGGRGREGAYSPS